MSHSCFIYLLHCCKRVVGLSPLLSVNGTSEDQNSFSDHDPHQDHGHDWTIAMTIIMIMVMIVDDMTMSITMIMAIRSRWTLGSRRTPGRRWQPCLATFACEGLSPWMVFEREGLSPWMVFECRRISGPEAILLKSLDASVFKTAAWIHIHGF